MSEFHATAWRNLSERTGDGCTVTLDVFLSERETETQVRVKYQSPTADFTLYPPNDRALDAFHHPFVYLNTVLQRGTYRTENVNGREAIIQA